MRMKRSEFRAFVKEIVRECLRDVIQEQINPGMMQNMVHEALALPSGMSQHTPNMGLNGMMVNPYDDNQMIQRQQMMQRELQQQKTMLQNTMQRQQQMHQTPGRRSLGEVVGLSELAGLGGEVEGSPQRYASEDTGYRNPSDYAAMAGPTQYQQQQRYNSQLDTPVGGSQHYMQQQPQQQAYRWTPDPNLDTPIAGGDMRPPDPNVMADIMRHTMQTTLQEQAMYGHTRPGSHPEGGGGGPMGMGGMMSGPVDQFAAVVAQNRPEDLFPGSENWAMLALK